MNHLDVARLLDAQRASIVDYSVGALMQDSFWFERFGPGIAERLALDLDANLVALVKSIRYRSPMIFDDHLLWRRNQIMANWGCSTGHVRAVYGHTWEAVSRGLPPEAQPLIYEHINSALQSLAFSRPSALALAAAHEQVADDVVAASFDSSWHWQSAYAADGRAQLLYDTWFLIDYLIDALGSATSEALIRRVRWTRDQLQKRGLASAHMQQLCWLVAEAANQHLQPQAAADAGQLLENCAAQLGPRREASQALLAAQDAIVGEVAAQLVGQGLASPEQAALEVGWYLAYLGDSLETGNAAAFGGYTRWMQQWFANQGLPDTPLLQALRAIEQSAVQILPQYAAHEVQGVLRTAR